MKITNLIAVAAALLMAGASEVRAAEHESNIEKTFHVTNAGKLVIDADRGSINVKTDGADQVQIHVFRRVKGGSKEKADALFNNHEVTLTQDGNTVSINAKNKQPQRLWRGGEPNFEVRYEISIPKKFDVDLKTAGGDIAVADLDGSAAANTSSGSIKLNRVSGTVQTKDAGGDIFIEEAGGAVAARTSSGSINVRKAGGKVDASNAGGDISVGEAAGVAASTSSGSVKLSKVNGDVEVKNAGGNITVESAFGSIKAATTSGSIRVASAKGKEVEIRNAGGDIELGDLDGSVSVETTSGSIKIKSAKGDISAKDAGGDIVIGESGNTVTAQTSSGSIRIKSARGAVDLKNSGGNISLQEAGGAVTANTTSGSIHVGSAIGKVEARNAGGNISVGHAQDAVIARTSSGEIAVNFGSTPKSESRIDVSGGGIKLGLPRSAAVDLDAHSSGGAVTSTLPVASTVSGKRQSGVLQGKINGGGTSLVLRSSSGDIRISEMVSVKVEAEK